MSSTVHAVTFNFHSTLYVPRDENQLEAVQTSQAVVLRSVLTDAGFSVSIDSVENAYQPPTELRGQVVTLLQTVEAMCRRLGIDPPQALQRRLARALDELAAEIRWMHAPGAAAVLRHLRQRDYRLGLVANTHLPSGRVVRQILAADGTLTYFQAFVFSDEIQAYKPHPAMFQHALRRLGMEDTPEAVVHMGEDPRADVAGAKALGMRTVRYAGFQDHAAQPDADAVIHDFRELPDLIHGWH